MNPLDKFYNQLNQLADHFTQTKDEADLNEIKSLVEARLLGKESSPENELRELGQVKAKIIQGGADPQSETVKAIDYFFDIFPIKSLPGDVINHILSFLNLSDVKNLKLVFKALKPLMDNPQVIAPIIERNSKEISLKNLLAIPKNIREQVKVLNFSRLNFSRSDEELNDADLLAIVNAFPNLRELNLSYCDKLTDTGVEHLQKLKELRYLELFQCTKINGKSFKGLSEGCLHLEGIGLNGCESLTDETFLELKPLLNKIKRLNLGFTPNLTIKSMDAIAEYCKNIENFNLSYFPFFDDKACSSFLSNFHKLKKLMLTNENITGEEAFNGLIKAHPPLRELEIQDCPLTDEGIAKLSLALESTTQLTLTRCRKFTGLGFKNYLGNCNQLKELHLIACLSLTDEGLEFLAPAIKQLQILDLIRINIGNKGIAAIVANCQNLKKLCLMNCPITDVQLQTLLPVLNKIEDLNLGNTHITDESLTVLLSCKHLKRLNLRGSRITEEGLQKLKAALPHLFKL